MWIPPTPDIFVSGISFLIYAFISLAFKIEKLKENYQEILKKLDYLQSDFNKIPYKIFIDDEW